MNRCLKCKKTFPAMMGHQNCPHCGWHLFKLENQSLVAGPVIAFGADDDRWTDQTAVEGQENPMVMTPEVPADAPGETEEAAPEEARPGMWKKTNDFRD